MSCCGRPRASIETRTPFRQQPAHAEPQLPAPTIAFVYIGETRLVAEGPVTRRRYRFEHSGAIAEVDGRDAPSFAAIPHLRIHRTG